MYALPSLALSLVLLLTGGRTMVAQADQAATAYHYQLDIYVGDFNTTRDYNGTVQIKMAAQKSAHTILLRSSSHITVNNATVQVKRQSQLNPDNWLEEKVKNVTTIWGDTIDTTVAVSLETATTAESNYSVRLEFAARSDQWGFNSLSYADGNATRSVGLTNLGSYGAQRAFPCMDDNRTRTPVTLRVHVEKDNKLVLSNVRLKEVENKSNTSFVHHFEILPPIATWQLCWLMMDEGKSDVRAQALSFAELRVRTVHPVSQSGWDVSHIASIAELMFNVTGVPTGQDKIDVVVIPTTELQEPVSSYGVICIPEHMLSLSPLTAVPDLHNALIKISRSLSSQWFGGLLIPYTSQDAWLVAGMNALTEHWISTAFMGMTQEWELQEQIVLHLMQPGLALDDDLNVPINNYSMGHSHQLQRLLQYKGGAILRMIELKLKDVFRNFLKFFVEKADKSLASSSSLFNHLKSVCTELVGNDRYIELIGSPKSMEELMASYISRPGHPWVTVASNGSHFIISQEVPVWHVPLTHTMENDPNVYHSWLEPNSTMVIRNDLNSKWILLNINQTAFCRVVYDKDLLDNLTHQLIVEPTKIPRLSRAQLFDDVFASTMSGRAQPYTLLRLAGYLHGETEHAPWHTALANFNSLRHMLDGHSASQQLNNYILYLMDKVMLRVGFVPGINDSYSVNLMRDLVLKTACELGHPECLKTAKNLFAAWLKTNASSEREEEITDLDLTATLMCSAVSNGTTADWFSLLRKLDDTYDRLQVIESLACLRNAQLLDQFLTEITSTGFQGLSSVEAKVFLEKLASTPDGAALLLDWLMKRLADQESPPAPTTTVPPSTTVYNLSENATLTENFTQMNSTEAKTANSTEAKTANSTEAKTANSTEAKTANSTEAKTNNATDLRVAPIEEIGILDEDWIVIVMKCIAPKCNKQEQATKLDEYSAQNHSRISQSTLKVMQEAAKQIYINDNRARQYNGPIGSWLDEMFSLKTEELATIKPPHTVSDPTTTPGRGSAARNGLAVALAFVALALHCLATVTRR